jgi:hypothetical protein
MALPVVQQQGTRPPAPAVVASARAIVAARIVARISFLINLTSFLARTAPWTPSGRKSGRSVGLRFGHRRPRRPKRRRDATGCRADLDEGQDRQYGSGAKVGWYCAEQDGDSDRCRQQRHRDCDHRNADDGQRAPELTLAPIGLVARAENKGLCWIVERDLGDDSSLTWRDFPERLRSQYGVEMLTDLKVELTYGFR